MNKIAFPFLLLLLPLFVSYCIAQTTIEVFPYNAPFASGYVEPSNAYFSGYIKELGTGGCSGGANKGFIVFDLSTIPATAVIQTAVITLQGIGCNPAEGVFGSITGIPVNPIRGEKVTQQQITQGPVYADKLDWDIWVGPMSSPFTAAGVTALQQKIGTAFCVGIKPPVSGAVRRFGGYDSVDETAPKPILRITYTNGTASKPNADFHTNTNDTFINSAINFYDNSGNYPTSWLWDFGDSTTSTLKNPVHSYADTGRYTVKLTAANSQGQDIITKTNLIHINPAPPVPLGEFTVDKRNPEASETVQFTDLSTGAITTWEWHFGDSETSDEKDPEHTYVDAGMYTVTLIVSGPSGSDTIEKLNFMNVGGMIATPVADFTADQSGGLTVLFQDISTNFPDSWEWDFGDGDTSASQHPEHIYANDGSYTVCLLAGNAAGTDSTCKNIVVQATGIPGNMPGTVYVYPNPSGGLFTISNTIGQDTQAELINPLGQQVLSFRLKEGINPIDLTKAGPGIYRLLIISNQLGNSSTQVIITGGN